MIFGINTTHDISKLSQFRNITRGIYAKYLYKSCYYLDKFNNDLWGLNRNCVKVFRYTVLCVQFLCCHVHWELLIVPCRCIIIPFKAKQFSVKRVTYGWLIWLIRDLGTSLTSLRTLWMSRCGLIELDGISSVSSLKVNTWISPRYLPGPGCSNIR